MRRRTRFTLRERIALCHELPPRVARTSGRIRHGTSLSRSAECAVVMICPMVRGPCRRWLPTRVAKSMFVPVVVRMYLPPSLISWLGARKPVTGSKSVSIHGATGIRGASSDSAEKYIVETALLRQRKAGPVLSARAPLAFRIMCESDSHHYLPE